MAEDEWIEELPSPQTDEEFLELAEELLREVEVMAAEKMEAPWTNVNQSVSGVKCMEKHGIMELEGTPLTLLKAEGVIEGLSPMEILELTLELDVSKRSETDPDLKSLKLVREISPTVQVTMSEVSCPWPVTNRCFLDVRTWRIEEGGARVVYGSKSINCPTPSDIGGIRGKAFNGVLLQSDGEDATHMTFLGYVDPKGWVPLGIIAAFKGKITEKYDIYRKVAKSGSKPASKRRGHQRSKSSVPMESTTRHLEVAEEAPPKRGHRRSYSGARSLRTHARRSLEDYEEKKRKKAEKAAKSPRKRGFHRRGQSITGRISLASIKEEEGKLSRSSDRITRISPRTISSRPTSGDMSNRTSKRLPSTSISSSPPESTAAEAKSDSDIAMLRMAVESMQRQQELNSRVVMMLIALLVLSLGLHFVR